jgi:hypothetical protein
MGRYMAMTRAPMVPPGDHENGPGGSQSGDRRIDLVVVKIGDLGQHGIQAPVDSPTEIICTTMGGKIADPRVRRPFSFPMLTRPSNGFLDGLVARGTATMSTLQDGNTAGEHGAQGAVNWRWPPFDQRPEDRKLKKIVVDFPSLFGLVIVAEAKKRRDSDPDGPRRCAWRH